MDCGSDFICRRSVTTVDKEISLSSPESEIVPIDPHYLIAEGDGV
jgi:hypothetical protein